MQAVLYKKNALIFENVFTVTFRTLNIAHTVFIYIYKNKQSRVILLRTSFLIFGGTPSKIRKEVRHALCACMRAVLYKKTPRFLEMISL